MKLASVLLAVTGMVLIHPASAETPRPGSASDYSLNPAALSGLKAGSDKIGLNFSLGFDANRPASVKKDFSEQPYGSPVVKSSTSR